MSDMVLKEKEILNTVKSAADILNSSIKETHDNIKTTLSIINEYIQMEKEKNGVLAMSMSECNAVFEKLSSSVSSVLDNTDALNKKLSASCTALLFAENQETLLKEVNASFSDVFHECNIETDKKIQSILDRLSGIAHRCGHFQSFTKPYKDIIDLYSVKIESLFGSLEEQMENTGKQMPEKTIVPQKKTHPAQKTTKSAENTDWIQRYKTGKAAAFVLPERAIVELTEAIRINPDYADLYYFRSIAYKQKVFPDYEAALSDAEKAYSLSPETTKYVDAVEKIKAMQSMR